MMDEKLSIEEVVNIAPLNNKSNDLASKIIEEDDLDVVKNLTKAFNLTQAKKNTLRVLKLNSLLDNVTDSMIKRFQERPGEFSNTDLINYMNTVQGAIDRANKSLQLIDEAPAIQVNQVNINMANELLDKDSRSRVADAVQAVLAKIKQKEEAEEVIDIIEEPVDEEINERKLLEDEQD